LLDCPRLPRRRIASNFRRGQGIVRMIVRRVRRDQLALQVSGEISENEAEFG
jgi:hypothetical protein